MTSLKQTSLFTEETLTSSQEDSHASHTHQPENEKAKKMSDISGRKCCEQLEKFNHVGLWAKMFSALLIGQEGWYSTRCKLTWKLRGTKYGRMYCQLYPSTLPTEGTGFGLLPTPKTFDGMAESANSGKTLIKTPQGFVNIDKNGVRWGPSLNDIARNQLLPTPTAMDSTNATATMKSSQVKEGSMHSVTLTRAMSMGMLPTPATRDYKGARSTEALEEAGRNQTNSLPDAFAQTGKTSQLNPQFVLEMMGFPPDWTELPFLSGETNQSKQPETL